MSLSIRLAQLTVFAVHLQMSSGEKRLFVCNMRAQPKMRPINKCTNVYLCARCANVEPTGAVQVALEHTRAVGEIDIARNRMDREKNMPRIIVLSPLLRFKRSKKVRAPSIRDATEIEAIEILYITQVSHNARATQGQRKRTKRTQKIEWTVAETKTHVPGQLLAIFRHVWRGGVSVLAFI